MHTLIYKQPYNGSIPSPSLSLTVCAGRGTAYCHVADHLRCYMWARKECDRYGDGWSKKWAQEPVFTKVHSELPAILENHCVTVNENAYTNWRSFLAAFLARGECYTTN